MTIRIERAIPQDIETCVRIACDSEIGQRYGFEGKMMTEKMVKHLEAGGLILVALELESMLKDTPEGHRIDPRLRKVIGFAWIDEKGGFGQAPYLKLIAIDPSKQNMGIGSLLLKAFEDHTRGMGRGWFLLVSHFNTRAIRFYARHGYTQVGALPDFVKTGITELIMYKAPQNYA